MTGRTIGGRYALCGEIASGGMATVHLARQVGAGGFARIVAIKRLHERYARDPEFAAMLLDEARIVARIRHPNVVQTIDVVAEDGELFLVMDYVHGDSLLRMMQMAHRTRSLLPIPVVAAAVAGALHGLHEAHEARCETGEPLGIVHRDVSPHNILVGIDGIARVLDFGIAQASQRIQTTHEGELKGKLSYMAPEQVMNGGMDRRTDVYSAAVVLWEALAGEKLFQGESEAAVINQLLLAPPRTPSSAKRPVPPALEAIVMRALAREPAARFATAREMALAIERATTLATPSEMSAALTSLCESSITPRAELIANIEMHGSSSSLREAVDSLKVLTSSRPDTLRAAGEGEHAEAPAAKGPPTPWGTPLSPRAASVSPSAIVRMRSHDSDAPLAVPGRSGEVMLPTVPSGSRRGVFAAIAASAVLIGCGLTASGYLFMAKRGHASASQPSTPATNTPSPSSSSIPAIRAATCPEGMALVPAGRFFMGSDDDLPAEKPAHRVSMHAYCMDKLEVTTDAYRACSDRGDCKRAGLANKWEGITTKESRTYDPLCNAQNASHGTHPINCIDWMMADRFCKAEGKRLPTEAEWEYAARGSDGRKFPWGDSAPSPKLLNACGPECATWGRKHGAALESMFGEADAWSTTAPVGSFPLGASRWGMQDMVGNVWEWVADYYAPYEDADQEAPRGPATGTTRAMRGGSWNGSYADWVRPTFRFHDVAETRSHGVGFRCARDLRETP